MKYKAVAFLLVPALAGAPPALAEPPAFVPLNARDRISSTNGFSFVPPPGDGWLERFGAQEITYLKELNPTDVSFYCGAVEGPLRTPLATEDELLAFVRSRKEDLGPPGRYTDATSNISVESDNDACVRYELLANDRGAKNKGDHEALAMRSVGRFCVDPQTRATGVDIYYSIRHVPGFKWQGLASEGETFLSSLLLPAPE